MADFGNAGDITVRGERINSVILNVKKDEYLFFRVTVDGAEPIFTFGCSHRDKVSAIDFDDHPQQVYEWTFGKNGNDIDTNNDLHTVMMIFTAALKYTLFVQHRDKNNKLIEQLKDIDFESKDPTDLFGETLRIFVV